MFSTAEQRYQHVLRGSTALCPWWQRGRMTLRILGLPSSPKGEIVGILAQVWCYGTGVVLDGNSLWWQISVQTTRIKRKFIYAGSLRPCRVYTQVRLYKSAYAYTRTFMQRKARICWKTYLWSMTVSPWNLNLWFWTMVSRQTCWSLVLSWWYCVTMVLDRGIVKGLRL